MRIYGAYKLQLFSVIKQINGDAVENNSQKPLADKEDEMDLLMIPVTEIHGQLESKKFIKAFRSAFHFIINLHLHCSYFLLAFLEYFYFNHIRK